MQAGVHEAARLQSLRGIAQAAAFVGKVEIEPARRRFHTLHLALLLDALLYLHYHNPGCPPHRARQLAPQNHIQSKKSI